LDAEQLKSILKSAIVELIQENREEVFGFLAEITEDIAMERAIAEGETTELVSRDSIFQLLGRKV
jgi:dsDNA-binding SOS-regulon protein